MITICKVCTMEETLQSNGDCDWCNECYSVEQGFIYLTEWDHNDTIMVDEDGSLYNEDLDVIGSEL